jgi:hypothetical protein
MIANLKLCPSPGGRYQSESECHMCGERSAGCPVHLGASGWSDLLVALAYSNRPRVERPGRGRGLSRPGPTK